jgi:hypothetical protein
MNYADGVSAAYNLNAANAHEASKASDRIWKRQGWRRDWEANGMPVHTCRDHGENMHGLWVCTVCGGLAPEPIQMDTQTKTALRTAARDLQQAERQARAAQLRLSNLIADLRRQGITDNDIDSITTPGPLYLPQP